MVLCGSSVLVQTVLCAAGNGDCGLTCCLKVVADITFCCCLPNLHLENELVFRMRSVAEVCEHLGKQGQVQV